MVVDSDLSICALARGMVLFLVRGRGVGYCTAVKVLLFRGSSKAQLDSSNVGCPEEREYAARMTTLVTAIKSVFVSFD